MKDINCPDKDEVLNIDVGEPWATSALTRLNCIVTADMVYLPYMTKIDAGNPKPVHWVGSSHDDLRKFPAEAAREIGYALWFAQMGDKHPSAKPLKGFKGAGVLEIAENHAGDTYRAVYTVRFAMAVYVLHAFPKKSKSGIKTPRHEIELIQARLKWAKSDHEQLLKEPDNEDTSTK